MIPFVIVYVLSLIISVCCSQSPLKLSQCQGNTIYEEGRILWGSLGDLIDATPFLPITINVPDMIHGVSDFMNNMYQYMFGSEDSEGGGSTPRIYLRILEEVLKML